MPRSKYQSHVKPYFALIKSMRRDGATEEMIYRKLDVGKTAWNDYKNKYVELSDLLKVSKESLIAKIEESLFQQALKGNMTAIIFSLKNLKSSKWRDRQEITGGSEADIKFIAALERFGERVKQ